MKVKLFIIFFLVSVIATAQKATITEVNNDEILIKGQMIEKINGTLKLLSKNSIYYENIHYKPEVEISNGLFEYKITFNDEFNYPFRFLINDSIRSSEFFLSKKMKKINLKIDSLEYNFTPQFDKKNIYIESDRKTFKSLIKKDIEDINSKRDSIEKQYAKLKDKEIRLEQVASLRNEEMNVYNENLIKFIQENTKSHFALWTLISIFQGQGYDERNENAFNLFDEGIKKSKLGIRFSTELSKLKSMSVNGQLPNIDVFTTDDNKIELNMTEIAKNNTYTLIDFWFTFCSPCISEYEILKDVYKIHQSQNFKVIAISVDRERFVNQWKKHIVENNYVWQNYLDKDALFARSHNISYFPQNFLLNSEGVIIKKNISMKELDVFLKNNL